MTQVQLIANADSPSVRARLPDVNVQPDSVVNQSEAAQAASDTTIANLFKQGDDYYQKQLAQSKQLEYAMAVSNAKLDSGLQSAQILQDAAKQPPDQMLSYYQENYQKYVDAKLDGVNDPQTRAGLMETFNTQALSGQLNAFKAADQSRKDLAFQAADANIQSTAKLAADAPSSDQRELYNTNVKGMYDQLASSGVVDQGKANQMYQDYRTNVATAIVNSDINQGNIGSANAHMDELDSDFSLKQRDQLSGSIAAEKDRQEAQAQKEEIANQLRLNRIQNGLVEKPGDTAVNVAGIPNTPQSIYDYTKEFAPGGPVVMREMDAKSFDAKIGTLNDPQSVISEIGDLQQKFGQFYPQAVDQLGNGSSSKLNMSLMYYNADSQFHGSEQISSFLHYQDNNKAVDDQLKSNGIKDQDVQSAVKDNLTSYIAGVHSRNGMTDDVVNGATEVAKDYMFQTGKSASDAAKYATDVISDNFAYRTTPNNSTLLIPKVMLDNQPVDANLVEAAIDDYKIDPRSVIVPHTSYNAATSRNLQFITLPSDDGVRLVYRTPSGAVTPAYDAKTNEPIQFDYMSLQAKGLELQNARQKSANDAEMDDYLGVKRLPPPTANGDGTD